MKAKAWRGEWQLKCTPTPTPLVCECEKELNKDRKSNSYSSQKRNGKRNCSCILTKELLLEQFLEKTERLNACMHSNQNKNTGTGYLVN